MNRKMSENDLNYLKEAALLAEKGLPYTSPNPAVGALIVKNGRIIGRGFHKKAGLPHAEIEAINNCMEEISGSTMYVTLEPCTHYVRTHP